MYLCELWRCPINQHPKFWCEKNHQQGSVCHNSAEKNILSFKGYYVSFFFKFCIQPSGLSNILKSISWFREWKLMIDLTHSPIYGNNSVILKAEMPYCNRFFAGPWNNSRRDNSGDGSVRSSSKVSTTFQLWTVGSNNLQQISPLWICPHLHTPIFNFKVFQLNNTKVVGWPKRCQPRVIHSSISFCSGS